MYVYVLYLQRCIHNIHEIIIARGINLLTTTSIIINDQTFFSSDFTYEFD